MKAAIRNLVPMLVYCVLDDPDLREPLRTSRWFLLVVPIHSTVFPLSGDISQSSSLSQELVRDLVVPPLACSAGLLSAIRASSYSRRPCGRTRPPLSSAYEVRTVVWDEANYRTM